MPGRETLGSYIRRINYLGAQDDSEIHNNFMDFLRLCKHDDNFSFEEIKDGYAAFREKVCVPKFGYRGEPSTDGAQSTLIVLTDLQGRFVPVDEEEDEDDRVAGMRKEVGRQTAETWISLLEARPTSGHLELIEEIHNGHIERHLQTCSANELGRLLSRMKIEFSFDPQDTAEERIYANSLYDDVKFVFKYITVEQINGVQSEYLELYNFVNGLLPKLPKFMCTYVGYIVRDMSRKLPKGGNPFTNCKDVGSLKKQIKDMKDTLSTFEGDVNKLRVEDTLKELINAAKKNDIARDLFEDLMDLTAALAERKTPLKNGDRIFSTLRMYLFRSMASENLKPDKKMFEATVNMIYRVMKAAGKTYSADQVEVIKEAVDGCLGIYTDLTPELTKILMKLWLDLVNTGKEEFVKELSGHPSKDEYKKIIWKNFVPEIQKIIVAIGKMPIEQMEAADKDEDHRNVVSALIDFMDDLLKPLKAGKALPLVRKDLVTYIYNCVTISAPSKGKMARSVADGTYLTIVPKKDGDLIGHILDGTITLLKRTDLPMKRDSIYPVETLLSLVMESYDGNGKIIAVEHHKKFFEIYRICSEGESVHDKLIAPGYDEDSQKSLYFQLYGYSMRSYMSLVQYIPKIADFVPLAKYWVKWARVGLDDDYRALADHSFSATDLLVSNIPMTMGHVLPQIVQFFLEMDDCSQITGLVTSLYPYNPAAVHKRLQEFFDKIEPLKDSEQFAVIQILNYVADKHPEVYTSDQVLFLMELSLCVSRQVRPSFFPIVQSIAMANPKVVAPHFNELKNDAKYKKETLSLRIIIMGTVAVSDEKYCRQAIDQLMTYAKAPAEEGFPIAMGQLSLLVRNHKEYFEEKYKPTIVKIKDTAKKRDVKSACENLLYMLEEHEGQDYEEIYETIREQQQQLILLDKKVTATIETVVNLGDHVIKQSAEITEIHKDVENLDERVDVAEQDIEETKIKVEEVDNKTMTNAPKWSRDLTKLMNPKSDTDWRLLASRLRYTNEDIRGWSQQHDPCMALLSEWYATHKTSEATKGLLTILQEMDRTDAAIIVENAMKASEDVVEDEDFEYASPPPVFLSYQWGIQNEVKLLKQHLEMAGYQCWMDIGQMGGGDKLFEKIDSGIRAAKVIISCTTEKYAQSPNCNREVGLSVNLQKPIIPLLMEKMSWPPKGPMGPVFSEFLFVRFFQRGGEETKDNDQRYWPLPKFQELLMQLSFYVVPDESLIQAEYAKWWAPEPEVIKIDKKKQSNASGGQAQSNSGSTEKPAEVSPILFLSYQWGKQPQIKALYQRLVGVGYTVWMDIYQMGGGDSLYDKIDRGMRGCKVVVSCITPKYALSANCRREVSLADALKKPIIPLLLEQMKWPPDGPMSMAFTELLFINMYRDETIQTTWKGPKVEELLSQLQQHVPEIEIGTIGNENIGTTKSATNKSEVPQAGKPKSAITKKPTAKATPADSAAKNTVQPKGKPEATPKAAPRQKAGEGPSPSATSGKQSAKGRADKPPSAATARRTTTKPTEQTPKPNGTNQETGGRNGRTQELENEVKKEQSENEKAKDTNQYNGTNDAKATVAKSNRKADNPRQENQIMAQTSRSINENKSSSCILL